MSFSKSSVETLTLAKLFATELMEYIACLQYLSQDTIETISLVPESPLKKNIREAVSRMSERLRPISVGMYLKHIGFMADKAKQFEIIAIQLGYGVKTLSYKAQEFLEFCTLVCLLAVMGCRNEIDTASNLAIIVIDDVVQWFRIIGEWPEKSWDDLERDAEFF